MNPLVSSALVSAGSSAANGFLGQIFAGVNARRDYHYFTKKMDYQDKIQDENIANERAYNSPASVSARMRAAGLAPQTANNANAGLSSASPGVSTDGAGSGPLPQLDMSALNSRLAQMATTPVDDAVIKNQEAQAAEHNENAREQKLINDTREDNKDAYKESIIEGFKRSGLLNKLTNAEISNLENTIKNRDKATEAELQKACADLMQASAAVLNAQTNVANMSLNAKRIASQIRVDNSQLVLNEALANEANANAKNVLDQINREWAKIGLQSQKLEYMRDVLALNWEQFNLDAEKFQHSKYMDYSDQARNWLALFFGQYNASQHNANHAESNRQKGISNAISFMSVAPKFLSLFAE